MGADDQGEHGRGRLRRQPFAGVNAFLLCLDTKTWTRSWASSGRSRHPGAEGLDAERAALAGRTNKGGLRGSPDDVLAGADVLLGLSGLGAVSAEAMRRMAPDSIVFAMANPVPEVHPEEIRDDAAIVATGRSDYPNQINNVPAFPGVFRGALEVRARTINEEMKLAHAISGVHDYPVGSGRAVFAVISR